MTSWQVALASMVGGLLALERKALAQFMLARPIVVAPIIAWILGDVRAGFLLGVPLELFFLGGSAYGASSPNHETLTALFAAAVAACAGTHPVRPYALSLAFFLALPLAPLGKAAEAAIERWNGALVDRAEERILKGRPGRATRQLLIGLVGTFLMGAVATAVGTALGPAVGTLERHLPVVVTRGLDLGWALAIGVSAGLAIRSVKLARGPIVSAATAVAVLAAYGAATWWTAP